MDEYSRYLEQKAERLYHNCYRPVNPGGAHWDELQPQEKIGWIRIVEYILAQEVMPHESRFRGKTKDWVIAELERRLKAAHRER